MNLAPAGALPVRQIMSNDNFPPASQSSRWLVSTDWLAAHLRDPKIVVVDATYFLPQHNRNAQEQFKNAHIPGAVFFDIEAISDHSTELPHMLPGPTQFGEAVGSLGIGDGDTVVVYDNSPLFSAARVWWTFRIFGAKSVHLLDGGLPKWKAEGRPLESGETKPKAKKFTAEMNVGAVALLDDVRMALADDSAQVVDARSAARFAGKAPEPRPGLRSGHMPRSFNVPYDRLIENGRLKSREKIAAAFNAAGVDLDKPIITTCGSGVTAAVLVFALDALGKRHLWQLAIKPGRPMSFGQIGDTVVLGLPGNPVAVFVCFLLYAWPLLRRMGGAEWPEPRRYRLPALFAFPNRKVGRREFWRGILRAEPPGLAVDKFARDGSGLISGLCAADGLIDIPEDVAEVKPGDPVAFIPFAEFGIVGR